MNVDMFGSKNLLSLSQKSLVPGFNIATDFSPEFMHSVLLGVTRQFIYLMLDTSSSGKKYYLGKKAQHLDKIILNVKLPSEITRLPRSATTRKFWKASELRLFLLFYSLVFLKDLLPAVYYNH